MPDKQVGDSCYIGGENVYLYWRADLMDDPVVTPGEITADYGDFAGRLIPYSSSTAAYRVEFSFYVYGNTPDECERNCAGLISMARKHGNIWVGKSLMEYAGVLIEATSERALADWDNDVYYNTVRLVFAAVQRGRLIHHPILPAGQWLNIKGTQAAPCKIVLKPKTAINSFSILDLTIVNLKGGETFIVDGIGGSVSDFGRVSLIDFPTLTPGKCYLNPSQEIAGYVEYYPIY